MNFIIAMWYQANLNRRGLFSFLARFKICETNLTVNQNNDLWPKQKTDIQKSDWNMKSAILLGAILFNFL